MIKEEKIGFIFIILVILILISFGICIGMLIEKTPLTKICKEQKTACKMVCELEATFLKECPDICEREYNKCINK